MPPSGKRRAARAAPPSGVEIWRLQGAVERALNGAKVFFKTHRVDAGDVVVPVVLKAQVAGDEAADGLHDVVVQHVLVFVDDLLLLIGENQAPYAVFRVGAK